MYISCKRKHMLRKARNRKSMRFRKPLSAPVVGAVTCPVRSGLRPHPFRCGAGASRPHPLSRKSYFRSGIPAYIPFVRELCNFIAQVKAYAPQNNDSGSCFDSPAYRGDYLLFTTIGATLHSKALLRKARNRKSECLRKPLSAQVVGAAPPFL